MYAHPAPKRSCRPRQPTLPRPPTQESGQARVRSVSAAQLRGCVSASSHASLAPVPWAPSPPRGLSLLLPRAGETVAAGAVHRLARAHAPMACPRRPSVPDRRPAPALLRESGHGRQPPNPPLQSLAVLRSRFRVCQPCWFIPSQPPQGGAMNARAASELRRSVGAGNPHHNITHHCITPRINGGAQKERNQVGKGISRSKVLPAAGYTTRRYVKLFRQNFVAPFSVCPARS